MIPVYDMLNHSNPKNVSWRFNEARNGIEIIAIYKILEGSEV